VVRVQLTGPTKFPEKITALGKPAVALYPVINVPSVSRKSRLLWANAVDASPMESATDASDFREVFIDGSPYPETTIRISARSRPDCRKQRKHRIDAGFGPYRLSCNVALDNSLDSGEVAA
jgi:hypothetical protein